MKTWRVTGWFIGAFLLGSVLFWPAWTVAEFANRRLAPAALLQVPKGTIWHGTAQLRLAGRATAFPISWDFQPVMLLKLNASWRLTLPGPEPKGQAQIDLSFFGITVRDTDLQILAETLVKSALPLAVAFNPRGEATFRSSELRIGAGRIEGQAALVWKQARLSGIGSADAGEYELQMDGQGEHAILSVTTRKGVLQIAGQGEWARASGLRFKGTLTPPHDPPAEMQTWLTLLGQPVDGRYSLAYGDAK